MWPWVVRICVAALALIGAAMLLVTAWLWLEARPVLDQARDSYAALPAAAQCSTTWAYPSGYPVSSRAVQTQQEIEYSVYRYACEGAGLDSGCYYMRGGPRWLGFQAYRRAYLSQCEMRALNLHGETPLSAALRHIYPDRDPSTLNETELSCVALAARAGVRAACRRDATCCADSGVAQTREMPR